MNHATYRLAGALRGAARVILLTAALLVPLVAVAEAPPLPACQSTVTGDVRFHSLSSAVFGNTRTIRVLVPPGYDARENQARRYPVLYLLDGQNLFDACLSKWSHREWQVDETVGRLIRERKIPPLLVVGVDNADDARSHEYLPFKDFVGGPDAPSPAGEHFPDFLVHEVFPLVNGAYRTLTGHANTGIGGSSYGGVAALYALLARPNEFGYGLLESTSLQVGMGELLRVTRPLIARPRKVYIGVGGGEGEHPDSAAMVVDLNRRLADNFRAEGYTDANLKLVVAPAAHHTEDAWAARLPDALTFLFGDWREP